jgi:hypothetical protein
MGLVKRGNIWWMNIVFQGQRIRRSTGSSNRALADAIMAKVKVQLIEGQYFDRAEEQSRTFAELMDRFEREHLVKLASRQTGTSLRQALPCLLRRPDARRDYPQADRGV